MNKPINSFSLDVCVADWDGTLIEGYTLLDWVSFLTEQNIIPKSSLMNLRDTFQDYHSGNITYETLVTISGNIYATTITGMDKYKLIALANIFAEQSKNNLQPFFRPLMSLLSEKKIPLIIISGAPQEVIKAYCRNISILTSIFALRVSAKHDKYIGELASNYGIKSAKRAAIDIVLSQYNSILIGIGNAESDEPILRAAKFGFFIGPDSNIFNSSGAEIVSPDNIIHKVLQKLSLVQ